ncbi:hypothetical protein GCM10010245_92260 [Streptomyces spectabilis]|nr:hypothetical protein GCM10010245_92260 [Streptomyces spectabilis]
MIAPVITAWKQDREARPATGDPGSYDLREVVNAIWVEVVRRNPGDHGKGFIPQPKRWIVEQVNGTSLWHRRLARRYGHRPATSTSRASWASIVNMTRRLTTPAPTRRDALELAA